MSEHTVKGLSPKEAFELLESDPKAVLIDIRSSMEYLFVGHPKGSVHVAWIDEPDWDINPHFVPEIRKLLLGGAVCDIDEGCAPVILICRSGKRSAEAGKVLLDTASAYQNWCTESTLGTIFAANPDLRAQISIHSKANSGQLPHKSLSKESVLYQCNGSLERLQTTSIDIYYLHGPDINTAIDETLEAIGELHAAGACQSSSGGMRY